MSERDIEEALADLDATDDDGDTSWADELPEAVDLKSDDVEAMFLKSRRMSEDES